ncbi:MAG: hypothetical protein AM324_008110 [Candidatus Thorarchaeota archaeon SMTZ1-83]|nr:MAG: hypothetical protein AM324_09440 [Candidatus Thorarchaeota archaeon SMTZ1-83]
MDDEEPRYEPREEFDWSHYGDHESESRHPPLDGTDYVAIFIASLESIFLPLVLLAVVLAAIGLLFIVLP